MPRQLLAAAALLLGAAAASCSPPPVARDEDGGGGRRTGAAPPATEPAPQRDPGPSDPTLDAAIALFERRMAADDRDHLSATTLAELRLRRADEAADPSQLPLAEEAARAALARQPGHPAAVAALARAVAGQGRAEEGRRLAVEALSEQPRNARLLEAAFDAALAASDERGAAVYADRLLAVNEDPGTVARKAVLAARRGETDAAVALWRRAASDASQLGGIPAESASYRRAAGIALAAAGRTADAARELDEALLLNPADAPARRARAALPKEAPR